MNRLRAFIFTCILLTAVTIGANNRSRFDSGQMPLDNRAEYCEWINDVSNDTSKNEQYQFSTQNNTLFPTITEEVYDHIWELSHRLSQYRTKKIKFQNIPAIILAEINRVKGGKLLEIERIDQAIHLLESNADEFKNKRSTDKDVVQLAKLKATIEIPQQVQLLNSERALLQKEISDLENFKFTDWAMNSFMQAAVHRNGKGEVPRLDVELKLIHDGLKRKVEIYPIWMDANGTVKKASTDSYFEVSGNMVTEELIQAISTRKIPPTFLAYQKFTEVPLQTGEYTIDWPQPTNKKIADITFNSANTIRIAGGAFSNRGSADAEKTSADIFTSASNIAVDAFLDLGCLNNSKWAKNIVNRTEYSLKDETMLKRFQFSKIDERALITLNLLRTMNPQVPTSTDSKDRKLASRRESQL